MLDFALPKNNSAPTPTDGILDTNNVVFRAGKVIRIFGPGAESCCATLLTEMRNKPIAWVGSEGSKTLNQLEHKKLDWRKILFVHGKEDREWALIYLLKTGIFPILVFQSDAYDAQFLKETQSLLLRKNAMMFFLGEKDSKDKWADEEYFAYQNNHFLLVSEGK